jgi:hypothetical protein
LKEEHGLRVSKNGVLGKVFGFRSKVVMWDWRRLLVGELYDLNCGTNIIWVIKSRRMLWPGHVAHIERGNMHSGFWWGGSEGKRPLGRPSHRLANNIKVIFNK